MLILQLSAGQGPDECALAVGLAFKQLQKEAHSTQVQLTLLEQQPTTVANGYKSLLIGLDGEQAERLGQHWTGSILWQCKSPLRPRHPRKNWFIAGTVFTPSAPLPDSEIHFQACRASGAGGQHVNKTSSAIQARHQATGLSVRVESERSQHANKRLARLLLAHKLAELAQSRQAHDTQQRWQAHWQLERGRPVRRFIGIKFKEDGI